MNTYFKFVDPVILDKYLASKGLNASELTTQSFRNQRTRAVKKWDELLESIDLWDIKHNSHRAIAVRNGEFGIEEDFDADNQAHIIPFDSFMLGFADYQTVIDLMVEALPKGVSVKVEKNVTPEGHAKVTISGGDEGGSIIDRIRTQAINALLSGGSSRQAFYIDPVPEDVTDHLGFYMGDVVDALATAQKVASGMRDAIIQAMRDRRGLAATDERKVERHDTSGALEKYLNSIKSKFNTHDEVITQMPVPEHGMKSSRKWGIEVETGGGRGVDAPDEWDRKYDGSLYSAYDSNYGGSRYIDAEDCPGRDHFAEHTETYVFAGGTYTLDGEIHTAEASGYIEVDNPWYHREDECDSCGEVEGGDYYDEDSDDCAEFVSPILRSWHSRGLEEITTKLSKNPQNDSAGVHVHVEANDLTPRQIGTVVLAYQIIEPLIEASYRRNKREYCKPRPAKDVASTLKALKTAKKTPSRGDYGDGFPSGDRYVSVNLCALSAHGTIEFRAMGPVYEYEHLIKWASFCREMVNSAKNNVPVKAWTAVRDFNDVLAIFAKYGEETHKIVSKQMDNAFQDAELVEV